MADALSHAELLRQRAAIDRVDAALVGLLAERFQATRAIGALKARTNLPSVDPTREAEQTARLRALAADAGIDPDFVERLFRLIVTEVVAEHEAAR